MKPTLSIVILCYKAGQGIVSFVENVIREIEPCLKNWEIVLVANYDRGDVADKTPSIVRDMASRNPRIRTVTLEKQGMMGWDARTGFSLATGDAIAFVDGDGQFLPRDVVRVFEVLNNESLDLVQTYREVREDGLLRAVYSRIYNLVFRMLFQGTLAKDINSKPKIFTRQLYERLDLKSNDWFLDAEIVIQARRLGAKFKDIPTRFRKHDERRSFVRLKHTIEFAKNLIAARIKEFFISQ